MRVFTSAFSPLICESVIEPIGVTLLLGESICDLGMEEDGERLMGKEGCETARSHSQECTRSRPAGS